MTVVVDQNMRPLSTCVHSRSEISGQVLYLHEKNKL